MKYKELYNKEQKDKKKLEKEKAQVERALEIYRQEEIKRLKEKKERWEAKVFCGNCHYVSEVLIPNGVTIEACDCTHCRVRGQIKLVAN